MSTTLAEKTCSACKGDEAPLKGDALDRLRDELGDDWNVVDKHHLEKTYTFDDFRQALDFTNRVGRSLKTRDIIPISPWPTGKSSSRSGHTRSAD